MQEREAYHEFRALVAEDVEHLQKHHLETAKTNWLCQCYESLEQFALHFPDAESRRSLISRYCASNASIAEELLILDPMIDALRSDFDQFPFELE